MVNLADFFSSSLSARLYHHHVDATRAPVRYGPIAGKGNEKNEGRIWMVFWAFQVDHSSLSLQHIFLDIHFPIYYTLLAA